MLLFSRNKKTCWFHWFCFFCFLFYLFREWPSFFFFHLLYVSFTLFLFSSFLISKLVSLIWDISSWAFGAINFPLSLALLTATPGTIACQAPLPMGFSRQEYWSGLPFPSIGDLPDPGIEPGSPTLQGDSLPSEPLEKPLYLTDCGLLYFHFLIQFKCFIISQLTYSLTHGERSVVGYSPWGCKESDTTEQLSRAQYKEFELPRWHSGKESVCQCRRRKRLGFNPWVRKIP